MYTSTNMQPQVQSMLNKMRPKGSVKPIHTSRLSRMAIYTKMKDAICKNMIQNKPLPYYNQCEPKDMKYTSNHVHVFILEAQQKRGRSHRQRGRNHHQKLTSNSSLAKTLQKTASMQEKYTNYRKIQQSLLSNTQYSILRRLSIDFIKS